MPRGYTIISSTEKILLDSNAYFRLADNFYPLFSRTFGTEPCYQLFILSGTIHEYNYQSRLRSKFDWVDNERHKEDRKQSRIRITNSQKKSINETCRFFQSDCDEREPGCFSIRYRMPCNSLRVRYDACHGWSWSQRARCNIYLSCFEHIKTVTKIT